MAEENISPPMEAQQHEEAPMMKFSELESMVEAGKQAEDKGENLEAGQQQPPVDQGQASEDPVAKALAESGFKSVEELVKSQKEGHATITRLAQERKRLQEEMEAMAQFPQLLQQQMRSQQPVQPTQPQGQPDSLTAELFKDMAPFVDQLVAARAQEIASNIVDQKLTMRELGGKVNAKRAENPEEFDDLRPIMLHVLKENPHYEAHPDGLNMVYERAKQVRDSRIANMASKMFGTDLPLDKIREAIQTVMAQPPAQAQQPVAQQAPVNPSAYVPPTSAGTPPMAQKTTNYDSEIASRMKGKLSPQTVDEITDLWWQKTLNGSQSQNDNRPRR